MAEDAAPAPDDGGRDHRGEGSSGSEKIASVAEKLLEHLDVAASLVLSLVQDHIIEPIESVRRVLWVTVLVLVAFAGFAIGFPEIFMAYLPYITAGLCLAAAAAAVYLDQQAKALKQRVRDLARKAETWRKVASWAKNRLD